MQWFREKFGATVVSVIVGFISLVFIFYGFFSPRSTRGLHDGAVAGTVNGEPIGIREYQQSLNQRLEFFRKMAGGKISDEQLAAFHIHESVFQDLARRKLMIQEAVKEGLVASDAEVMSTIEDIPQFKKDGQFDFVDYKETIEASPYGNTGAFERAVRDDLTAQRWQDYFKRRVAVTDEEARSEFLITQDKRNIKYVLLTSENGAKGVHVGEAEIRRFLSDPSKLNLVRAQYESKKPLYPGKTFEQVRDEIAKDVIASSKIVEVQKVNDKLAGQVADLLKAGKGPDAKLDSLLKPYGAQVKTTGMFNRMSLFIPGVGESKELFDDAFAARSPIDPRDGGRAKVYTSPSWKLVAVLVDAERADPSKFEASREDMIRQIALRKQRALFEDWLTKLAKSATIEENHDVVRESSDS